MTTWPQLRTYTGRRLRRIALPLGGIGTGTVSFGGRGNLRDWEIVNRPAKGFHPGTAFFAIRTESPVKAWAPLIPPIPYCSGAMVASSTNWSDSTSLD